MPEETKQAPLEDSNPSPLDRLAADGFAADDEPAVETESAAEAAPAAAPPELSALAERLAKAEERAFLAEQRSQFTAGQLAAFRQEAQPKPQEPQPFVFNKDDFAAALEKDPAGAIHSLALAVSQEQARNAGKEVEGKVDSRFGQIGQQQHEANLYNADRTKTVQKYGQIVTTPEFIKEADQAILEVISARTGKEIDQLTLNDRRPGDLFAAAAIVYGDWAAAGKLPKAGATETPRALRSLREIIAAVPKQDGLGTPGARTAQKGKVQLSDLYSAKEMPAVQKMIKEFGCTPEEWIANVSAATRENDDFGV